MLSACYAPIEYTHRINRILTVSQLSLNWLTIKHQYTTYNA